ncbi:MAG: hypothetical protein QOH21_2701 [Acidobacteriota bacterium]|nr:hypothetical protein [Acidobacteriota bacterium]
MFDTRGEPRDPLTITASGNVYLSAKDTPGGAQTRDTYEHYIQRIFNGIDKR